MIYPTGLQRAVVQAVYDNHPYEEPAFDLLPLENESRTIGLGRIGELPREMKVPEFLAYLKEHLGFTHSRYAGWTALSVPFFPRISMLKLRWL